MPEQKKKPLLTLDDLGSAAPAGTFTLDELGEPSGTPSKAPEDRKGFLGALWENINPIPALKMGWETSPAGLAVQAYKSIKETGKIPEPPESAKALAQIPAESYRRVGLAGGALAQGNFPEAAKQYAAAIPLFGPPAVQVGEDIEKGQYPEAAGHAAGLMIPAMIGGYNPEIPMPIKSRLNAVQQAAVNFGERAGIPIDLATATGNPFVQGAKSIASKQPLSAGKHAALRGAQEEALASTGERLAQIPGAGTGSKVVAGEGVQGRLTKRIESLDTGADKAYTRLRDIAAEPQNVKTIQVGTKPSSIVNPQTGQPVQVPVYETFSGPTDLKAAKAALASIVDSIEKSAIPETLKQSSPGLTAMRAVVNGPDIVDIDSAIRNLSSIQNIARSDLPAVRGASKGIAAAVIPQYRAAIDAAAKAMGPEAEQMLNRGRALTTQKYQTFKVLDKLPKSPVQLVRRLTLNEDSGIDMLRAVNKFAPAQMPDIGRSVLEGILSGSTAEGGFNKAGTALNRWNKLGPETKKIIFNDPARVKDIDDFLMLAKMIGENPNPSGSATVGGIIGATGLVVTSPVTGFATLIGWKKLADILMRSDGPALLRKGLTLPLGDTMAPAVYAAIASNAAEKNSVIPPPPQQ